PAGTGVPTGAGTAVTSLPVTINNLLPDTAYEVYVRAECSAGFYSDWSAPYTFTTEIQTEFTVDCTVGPTNVTYCYGNNDTTMFTFTSSDLTIYLTAIFNSGTLENGDDEIIIYDSDGTTVLYSGYGNSGDLAGLEMQSTGGVIYIQINSDGSNSCATGEQSTLDFTVLCTTCINPTATYSTVSACDVQNQVFEFYVDVEITDMGDATSITIDDSMGSATQIANGIGTYTFGPYTNTIPVNFTVANADDPNCVLTSTGITQDECPPITDSLCQTVDAGDDFTADCSATISGVDLDADFFISGTSTTAYQLGDAQCIANVQTGTAVGINTDDVYSGLINIGFNFCYFGNTYNQLVVGANGVVSFNAAYANAGCPWAFTESIPDPGLPLNAIFGVYHDIHPGVCGNITYELAGTAPDRTFKINFEGVCQYSCTSLLSTSQIVLYESSNVVEINIIDKPTCTTWNAGAAAAGIQNADGTIGYFPPNRNTGVWTATNESWRFYPAGPANYTFQWLDGQGDVVSTDPETTVYPQGTTTYTAEVTYNQCDGTTSAISDDVVITINDFVDIGIADDLEACDEVPNNGYAEFDLTDQDAVIMNGLTGGVVTYYASYDDAVNGSNPLTSPYTNTEIDQQTIHARLDLSTTGCFGISDFEIIVNPAPEVSFPSASVDKFFCEEYTLEPTIANLADLSGTFEFAWYDDGTLISGATGSTYILAADGDEEGIFTVMVTDLVSGCSTSADVQVNIVGDVTAGQPDDMIICDDSSNDGYAEFDLTLQDSAVIDGQSDTFVTYYTSYNDAQDGVSPLSSPYTNEDPNFQTIYASLENTVSGCTDIVAFDIMVYNTPFLDFDSTYYEVCSNGIIATTITTSPSGFALTDVGVTFTWYQNGTTLANSDNVLDVYDAGEYA
ncbi:fibronectin type III domain-containing protein, partial [Neptunitalea chrysea]|uniref:fibronectin type III domain-containing protein n=1 Tax=Neptunitalea chrysea TaxID=1647581 RepID=UPI00249247C8